MKKVLFLLAVGAMFSFAACNSQPAEEPKTDEQVQTEEQVQTPAEPVAADTANVATETPAETPAN